MIPRILCRACNNEVGLHDKFCSICGEKVDWGGSSIATPQPAAERSAEDDGTTQRCPLCGHENPLYAVTCKSCGAKLSALSGKEQSRGHRPVKEASAVSSYPPLKSLQSWKVTLGIGIVLIAVIVALKLSHSNESPIVSSAPMPPNVADMQKRIESLQKVVDANPNDAEATLQLANLLHDAKSLPQSIALYKRYLETNPSNPDARVDLGISYFEMSIGDSTHRAEYSHAAQQEMEKALTYEPKHQLAHFNLGVVCLHNGDVANAVEWFRKCIAIDPNSETGKRAQQLLNQHSFNNPS